MSRKILDKTGMTKVDHSTPPKGMQDGNREIASLECSETNMGLKIRIQDVVSLSESAEINYCRLCASLSGDTVSIFGEEGMKMELAYKINKNLPIMVSQTNKLPLDVCMECITQLDTTVNFVNKCVRAQFKIERMFQTLESIHLDHLPMVWSNRKNDADKPNLITYSKSKHHMKSIRGDCFPSGKAQLIENEPQNDIGYVDSSIIANENEDMGTSQSPSGNSQVIQTEDGIEIKAVQKAPLVDLSDSENTMENVVGDVSGEAAEPESEANTHRVEFDLVNQVKNQSINGINPQSEDNSNTMRTEHKYFCQYCSEGFKWKAELFCHQTSAHPDLVFRCSHCLKVFYECREDFLRHEEAHRSALANMKHRRRNRLSSLNRQHANVHEVNSSHITNGDGCQHRGEIVDSAMMDTKQQWVKKILAVDMKQNTCVPPTKLHRSTLAENICTNEVQKDVADQNGSSQILFDKSISLWTRKTASEESCSVANSTEKILVSLSVDVNKQEKLYKCKLCDLSFKTEMERNKHRKANHMLRLPCRFCPRTLNYKKELEQHEATHFSDCKHKCRKCGEGFNTVDALNKHRNTHTDGPRYNCEFCKKLYYRQSELLKHVKIHSDEKPFLCEKCGKNFKTSSNLSLHRRFYCENQEVAKKYVCDVCQKKFFCKSRLRVHMRIHTGEKPYKCSTCGKGFHAMTLLTQHTLTHSSVKYPCPFCGVLFNRKSNMISHSKRHNDIPCGICGEMFAGMQLLLSHRKTHTEVNMAGSAAFEGSEDPAMAFKCEECGKLLASKLSLKTHKLTHSKERPYKCPICEKRLRHKVTLRKHMDIHSGKRPYQCRHCTRTFILYQSMVKHEKVHSMVKPYSCQECGKSYQTPVGLSNHMAAHSAEHLFTCNVCNKSFARKISLLIHKRNHMAKQVYPCSFCSRTFSQLRLAQRHERSHVEDPKEAVIIPNILGQDFLSSPFISLGEESCTGNISSDNIAGEVLVYDSQTINAHYSEIIIVSDKMGGIVMESSDQV